MSWDVQTQPTICNSSEFFGMDPVTDRFTRWPGPKLLYTNLFAAKGVLNRNLCILNLA